MRRLYREEYADFTPKHFHEGLYKRHGYHLGYTRLALHSASLVKAAPTGASHEAEQGLNVSLARDTHA